MVFASAAKGDRPKPGDHLYFEIPAGIEQIETLKTEVHLFLFGSLPSDPQTALSMALRADARFQCRVLGAENQQGNRELNANWRIDQTPTSALHRVSSGIYRPKPASNMQQVRAEVAEVRIDPFEYQFERERVGWDPELSPSDAVSASRELVPVAQLRQAVSAERFTDGWQLVTGLSARTGAAKESDQAALKLAAPESGAFILVSLRRRRKGAAKKADHT